jgi:hypothetical protein
MKFSVSFTVAGMGPSGDVSMPLEVNVEDEDEAALVFQEWLAQSEWQKVYQRLPGAVSQQPMRFRSRAVNGFTLYRTA